MGKTTRQRNKDLIEQYGEAYNQRDRQWFEEHLADPVVFDGAEVARDDALAAYEMYWNAFPDCEISKEEVIAEGDTVVVRERFTGTHDGGPYRGIEPTGAAVDVSETVTFRIEDGRIAEIWFEWDELGMYEQLGVIEHPVEQ